MTYKIPNITKHTNGFVSSIYPNYNSDSVSIQLRGKAGSNYENFLNIGCAHMTEHMLCKYAQLFNINFRNLFNNGGKLIGITSRDDVIYGVKCLSDDVESAINGLYELFCTSMDNQDILDNQKQIVYSEILRYLVNPEKIITRAIYKLLFPEQRISLLNSGEQHDVAKIQLKDISDFFSRFYIPSNFNLSISGNVKHRSLNKLIESTFGNKKGIKTTKTVKLVACKKTAIQTIPNSNAKLWYVKINWQGYEISNSKKYAAVILARIMELYLNHNIHENVNIKCASFSTGSYGFIDLFFTCTLETIYNTISKISVILQRPQNFITTELLTRSINITVADFYYAFEKNTVRADYYGELLLHGTPDQNHISELSALKNMTLDNLMNVYKQITSSNPKITIVQPEDIILDKEQLISYFL